MDSARKFHTFLTPHACISFSAQQSAARIWNPSSRISERRVIVASRNPLLVGGGPRTCRTLFNRSDDLIAQELSEIFDPESSPSPNVKREEPFSGEHTRPRVWWPATRRTLCNTFGKHLKYRPALSAFPFRFSSMSIGKDCPLRPLRLPAIVGMPRRSARRVSPRRPKSPRSNRSGKAMHWGLSF